MTVYVDDMEAPFREMIMCHMIADTDEELHAMAEKIGILRKWFQGPPKHRPHYDIDQSARPLAVSLGAVEVTWSQCSAMTSLKAIGEPMGEPTTAEQRFLDVLHNGK